MPRRTSRTASLLKTDWRGITPYESLFWEHSSPGSMRNLLMAALECFAEQGFHGTSTREIAKRAHMSPAAMYVHFKSKEEMLFHIGVVMARAGLESLEKVAQEPGSFSERLHRMARSHAAFHARMSTAARVTNFEIQALQPKQRKVVLGYYAGTEDIFRTCLREGKAAGEFSFADLSITTTAILSLILSVCRWYIPGGRLPPEDVGGIYATMILGMASAEPIRVNSAGVTRSKRLPASRRAGVG